jgi:hypothetical protein
MAAFYLNSSDPSRSTVSYNASTCTRSIRACSSTCAAVRSSWEPHRHATDTRRAHEPPSSVSAWRHGSARLLFLATSAHERVRAFSHPSTRDTVLHVDPFMSIVRSLMPSACGDSYVTNASMFSIHLSTRFRIVASSIFCSAAMRPKWLRQFAMRFHAANRHARSCGERTWLISQSRTREAMREPRRTCSGSKMRA